VPVSEDDAETVSGRLKTARASRTRVKTSIVTQGLGNQDSTDMSMTLHNGRGKRRREGAVIKCEEEVRDGREDERSDRI
jgi:hypothetical protein